MILIGSRALTIRAPHLLTRPALDFDFVCTKGEFDTWMEVNSHKVNPTKVYPEGAKMIVEGSSNCEFEISAPGSSIEMLMDIVSKDPSSIETPFGLVPTLDMLFTIKSSHRYKKNSPHFWKTLIDYHRMKFVGAKVRDEYKAFLKLRESETYTYLHPKLNVNKNDFFKDDGIEYQFDHDDIHQSVALHDKPAYTYYLKDGQQVQCDKKKFFACDRSIQLAGVVEEAAVLAIERSLVPHPNVWTPEYAWRFALSKVCSSITSGWFREFAYNNAFDVLAMYPNAYWDKFQLDVNNGNVKPFNGSRY